MLCHMQQEAYRSDPGTRRMYILAAENLDAAHLNPPYPHQTSSFKPLVIWSEALSAALSSSASCALFRGRDSPRGPVRRRFDTGCMAPTVEGVAVACIEGVQVEGKEHETKAVSRRTQVLSPSLLLKHRSLSLCKGFSLANLVAPWPVGDSICLLVTAAGHVVTVVLQGRCVTASNAGWRVSTKASKTSESLGKQNQ